MSGVGSNILSTAAAVTLSTTVSLISRKLSTPISPTSPSPCLPYLHHNTLSPPLTKHILLSHCFLLWDLPTRPVSPSDTLLHHRNSFLLKVYKTVTNPRIGTTGTHQRHSGRSRVCFQANSWTTGYMSLLSDIISTNASFEHQPATQKSHARWTSTPAAQGQARHYQEKSIIELHSKGNPVFSMVLVPFLSWRSSFSVIREQIWDSLSVPRGGFQSGFQAEVKIRT